MSGLRRVVGLAMLLAAVFAVPVRAAAPEQSAFETDFEAPFAACTSFEVIAIGWLRVQDMVFAERDGSQRIVEQFAWQYTLIRSDDGSVVGSGGGHSTLLAPLDGTQASTWVGVRTTERYLSGVTVREVGRIVFDEAGEPVFVAGPHPFGTSGVDRCSLL
jgi:hypothetical protein